MEIHSLPDRQLLSLFCDGNRHAFDVIYDRYWNSLYRTSFRILEDEAKAKDVVQEVFLSFYEKAGTRAIANVKGYLFQCAKFQCFMQLRSGRISEKHLQRMNQVIMANLVEEAYDASELEHLLEESMALLPEKCRQVFYLSRFEFLSNIKIAEQLNISPKTVESQMTKALKSLKMAVQKFVILLILLF
jgi:RNA polymerase sigma-70 factor (ECF subfamily)